jgi:hypothetical protein
MSRKQRLKKSQQNTINEEPYASVQKPTIAAFISKETMEGNAEKKSVR